MPVLGAITNKSWFAGVALQRWDFGIFLEIIRGLNEAPSVRGEDVVVPGRRGRIARQRVADRLVIELLGMASGNDAAAFRANVDTLGTLFDPERIPASLVVSLEDDTTASIVARPINMVWREVSPIMAVVSIELESVTPDWAIT